jgi:hypothetical protein
MFTDGDPGIPPPGEAGLSRLADGSRLSYPNPTLDAGVIRFHALRWPDPGRQPLLREAAFSLPRGWFKE